MTRVLLMMLAMTWTASIWAQGARQFPDLNSLKSAHSYRLTCSSTAQNPHVHSHILVENRKVSALQLIYVYPEVSLKSIAFSPSDVRGLKVSLKTRLSISGKRPGSYWSEQFVLDLTDRRQGAGFQGQLIYDDGDGLTIERDVECTALNYILSP